MTSFDITVYHLIGIVNGYLYGGFADSLDHLVNEGYLLPT